MAGILDENILVLTEDVTPNLASGTISYLEFSQGLINNRNLINSIYEPTFNKRIFQI